MQVNTNDFKGPDIILNIVTVILCSLSIISLSVRIIMQPFVDSYKINLVEIVPYPVSTKTISQEEYSATLEISKMDKIIPPIKQVSQGIEPTAVNCKEGLVLILKYSDESPACVKLETALILEERGWGSMSQV